jgi:hypothetical protein
MSGDGIILLLSSFWALSVVCWNLKIVLKIITFRRMNLPSYSGKKETPTQLDPVDRDILAVDQQNRCLPLHLMTKEDPSFETLSILRLFIELSKDCG